MAKKSMISKNEKNREIALRYKEHRAELRKAMADMKLSDEERFEAMIKLQKLPRRTSMSRVINRCRVTGRPRGNMRKFGMSRITFREMASRGLIPGVTKSSW